MNEKNTDTPNPKPNIYPRNSHIFPKKFVSQDVPVLSDVAKELLYDEGIRDDGMSYFDAIVFSAD